MSKLYYCRQTTDKCKSIRYPSKAHPYKYGTSGCIYTSGCGVCASLMVLHKLRLTGLDTAAWTQKCLLMAPAVQRARIWNHHFRLIWAKIYRHSQ